MSDHDETHSESTNNFVHQVVRSDIDADTFGGRVQTRFPPEPNGYLHIGHSKAIHLNFELAQDFGGVCKLRFDDSNPNAEKQEFVDGIIEDMAWLGYPLTSDQVLFASDYFEQIYEWAELLVESGDAYVDEQDIDTIRQQRGGFGIPGVESPYRDRPATESMTMLREMRDGKHPEGSMVLRAKIDMQAENMQLRDPVLYRIRDTPHHRTGNKWSIYPTYDWVHGQSDAIEGVTHSLCTLEFEDHRPVYNWLLERLPLPGDQPQQTEFAALNLTHTVTSKRTLRPLIESDMIDGWEDPRLPTLRGMRRRGYPPAAIREFLSYIGVGRTNGRHQIELFESFVRTHLNQTAQRRMAVLDPIRLIITNWPNTNDGPHVEYFDVTNNPENEADGTRKVAFSGDLWIERDDFMIDPPKKFYRLAPGREIRLRNAYFVTCTGYETDDGTDSGQITTVHATYDPLTKGGSAPDGRKVKSTMHWVSAAHSVEATVIEYDRLFTTDIPGSSTGNVLDDLNHNSRTERHRCRLEQALDNTASGEVVQFERLGYFARDIDRPLVFHQTVGLRDEWARIQKQSR